MSVTLLSLLFSAFLVYSASCQCHQPSDSYIGTLCYRISDQRTDYKSAQNSCHGLGLNLAVVGSTLQANFLASQVRSKSGSNEALFWIGLSRATTGSRFYWDDGTTMTWSNFDPNFPKDDLVVAESVVNAKWRTLNPSQSLYFVCSYDPRNVTPGTVQPSTVSTGGTTGSTAWYTASTSSPPDSTISSSSTYSPSTQSTMSSSTEAPPTTSTSADSTTSSVSSTPSTTTDYDTTPTQYSTQSSTSGTWGTTTL